MRSKPLSPRNLQPTLQQLQCLWGVFGLVGRVWPALLFCSTVVVVDRHLLQLSVAMRWLGFGAFYVSVFRVHGLGPHAAVVSLNGYGIAPWPRYD